MPNFDLHQAYQMEKEGMRLRVPKDGSPAFFGAIPKSARVIQVDNLAELLATGKFDKVIETDTEEVYARKRGE